MIRITATPLQVEMYKECLDAEKLDIGNDKVTMYLMSECESALAAVFSLIKEEAVKAGNSEADVETILRTMAVRAMTKALDDRLMVIGGKA